jgi:DNA/RNA endonuclease G (NUC1)
MGRGCTSRRVWLGRSVAPKPQYWSLNQGEWLALENYTGAAANKYARAWAISGPVFIAGMPIETIGEDTETRIPIPHALFKVIVVLADEDIFVRAFLFNQPRYSRVKAIMSANGGKIPAMGFRLCRSTDQDAYDFAPFASSLSEIDGLTGVTFFPDASASEKNALNDFSSRPIWRIDRRFFERPCGEEMG